MKKVLFWPYQLYVWLVFAPLVVLLTLFFSFCAVISSILVNPQFGSRVFGVTWARVLARLTPIAVSVEGSSNAQQQRSYIVASNHQSMYDIFVIYGWLKLDMKWVMKQELRKVPGIGIGCEKVGHIFVERRDPKQAAEAISAALHKLGDGVGILFFPEGTRSLDGHLLPFKKGAFRTAIEQQLPILPVTVRGTSDILPNKTLKLFPGRATMVVHPPIETKGMTLDDLEPLLEQTRATIQSALPAGMQ